MQTQSVGRNLLIGMNVVAALNGLVADWNRTHLFNKKWPPHAKYHDAMGLSMGLALGALGIYALRRKSGDATDNVRLAALCPAIFFGAMVAAQAYPNADTIETEFPDYWPKIGRFSFNEVPFATTMLALVGLGWRMAESQGDLSRDEVRQLVERAGSDDAAVPAPRASSGKSNGQTESDVAKHVEALRVS